MSAGWNKIFRDLQQNKLRSALAVVAIAIGISGFGGVLSTYSILTRELNAGYLASNPASATLWLERMDDHGRANLAEFPGISAFEERRMISARVRAGTGEWKNAQLFVIQDFNNIRISTLKPQSGKWPPADGEILIERDALSVARAKIGDDVSVQMPKGSDHSLRLTGSVHDVGRAQARMEQIVYGYINTNTLRQLGEDAYLDELKIEVAHNKSDEDHVRKIVAGLKQFLEQKGHVVRRVEIPKPGAHPHADLMGTLLLYKSSFGFLALLLSGVLVINLLSAVMAGQIRQIGIMKAIGAKKSQVMFIYFGTVFVLSLFALVIAIPISVWSGRALSIFMSRFLNFDLQSYSISLWVYALQVFTGVVVPLLAAVYPVHRGARISVREAICDYGIPANQFGRSAFDRLITRSGGLTRPLLLSLRNTFRRRGRFALILSTLTIGGTIFIAAWNVRASLIHTVDRMLGSLRYDLTLSFAEFYPDDKLDRVILSTPGVKRVERWAGLEAMILDEGSVQDRSSFQIVAPPAQTTMLFLTITEGRSLRPDDTNAIVINNRLAAALPALQTGKRIRLRTGDQDAMWKIVGIARQALAGPAAYANRDAIRTITGQLNQSKNARVVTEKKDQNFVNDVKLRLEKNLALEGVRVTSGISMADRRRVIDEHNSVIYTFLIVMALLIVFVGGLGLMTVMSINVLERRREIGVLRSIGATKRKVLLLILVEGIFIGGLSWVFAVPLSFLISNQLGNFAAGKILHTNLEFTSDITGVLIWLVIVLCFGAAASFLPAWTASRLTVRELIEYE